MSLDPSLTELTTTSSTLVSFDWFEFASNQGRKVFNLADATGPLYFLTTETPYSSVGYSTGAVDEDYDFQIEKDIIVNGFAIVTIPIQNRNNTAGAKNIQTKVTVTIRHWDGTTETDIGTDDVTVTDTGLGANTTSTYMRTLKITLTRKAFTKGDTLRVNFVVDNTGTTGGTQYVFHDPANRLNLVGVANESSKFEVDMSFEVQE